jgi:hypothetical protein
MAASRIWASTRQHVFKYRRQDFFAENGLIHVIDKDTGIYSCVAVREFLSRARGFSKLARRMSKKKIWADERDELTRMVQDMIVCCQQAQRQGDPFDPRVLRQMAIHNRSARIVVPNPAATQPATRRRIIVTGR